MWRHDRSNRPLNPEDGVAYQTLTDGTRYVYDRLSANERIAEGWVHSELAAAANAYQTFVQNVWQVIIEKTQETTQQQVHQAAQLARVNDALSFLGEANIAQSQHLANFQGNVELWAADHQMQVATLERQLREAKEELQCLAARIPLSECLPVQPKPIRPGNPFTVTPQAWWNPLRPSTTSLTDALRRFTTIPSPPTPQVCPLGSPFPQRWRNRPPAVPVGSLPPLPPRGPEAGVGGRPPLGSPLGQPTSPRGPSPTP